MGIGKALGLAAAGVLGAATVVLPVAAGSEGSPPVVTAENVGLYNHYWTPAGVKVDPGGTVEFTNPTEVPHGIRWVSTPAGTPECGTGVPVGTTETASGKKWKGTCTFATVGTYTYYCTVHGASMSGTITVGTATTGTTTTTTGTTPTTTSTGTAPGTGTTPGSGATSGSALTVARLSSSRHGSTLRGTVDVAPSAAGGTLTVLVSARLGGKRAQVGRLTRAYVSAGTQSWSLALSARARRALHAKHRLALSVRIALTPPGGTASVLTRAVTAHT